MSKKAFLWFCGTGTEKKETKKVLKIEEDRFHYYIDGVATAPNAKDAETMQKSAKWESFFNYLKNIFGGKETSPVDILRGYQERHQEVQQIEAMDFLNNLFADGSVDKLELVIGGHSRGAAAGMIGFLSFLTALVDNYGTAIKKYPLFEKVTRITLIPVDPVGGVLENDLLQDGKTSVKDMLQRIENTTGKKDLFRVISFNARFDARKEFPLDVNWNQFFEEVRKPAPAFSPARVQFYVAGFRHSAMVDKSEEISSFYIPDARPGHTPTGLLKAIVDNCLSDADAGAAIKDAATALRKTEVAGIAALIQGKPVTAELQERTIPASYDAGKAMNVIPGSISLKDLLKTAKKGTPVVFKGRVVLTKEEWELIP